MYLTDVGYNECYKHPLSSPLNLVMKLQFRTDNAMATPLDFLCLLLRCIAHHKYLSMMAMDLVYFQTLVEERCDFYGGLVKASEELAIIFVI